MFSNNSYYGCEFGYYNQNNKIFKGYFVQDSIEGKEYRVLQINKILSNRENKRLLIYLPRHPKSKIYIEDCESFFNKNYLENDSILPAFNLKDLIKYRGKINKIKLREGKSRKRMRDSIVAVVIPHFSYPYKEKILRSLVKYDNYPVYLIDDFKKNRCFVLFPVMGSEDVHYYLGKICDVNLDYVIRSKKKLIFSCILMPFAFTFDVITSPFQLYLYINFPDKFMSKVKGF